MQLTINGEIQAHPDGLTILDLLGQLELDPTLVAVEVNRQLVPRRQHADMRLSDGDEMEIVTLVGGG
jgi:thiamine biosynthesis protein ThiS